MYIWARIEPSITVNEQAIILKKFRTLKQANRKCAITCVSCNRISSSLRINVHFELLIASIQKQDEVTLESKAQSSQVNGVFFMWVVWCLFQLTGHRTLSLSNCTLRISSYGDVNGWLSTKDSFNHHSTSHKATIQPQSTTTILHTATEKTFIVSSNLIIYVAPP